MCACVCVCVCVCVDDDDDDDDGFRDDGDDAFCPEFLTDI